MLTTIYSVGRHPHLGEGFIIGQDVLRGDGALHPVVKLAKLRKPSESP